MSARIDALLAQLKHPALPVIDLSLDRMRGLMELLGNPQRRLPPVIHVAGTNGKGSTLAFLRSIYQTAGYRVHSYTSPELVRFNERILLSGVEITDAQLLPYLEMVAEAAKQAPVTEFEATTAAAFLAYADHPADLLLLEVGLGGRLDATNVAEGIVASVLTPIDLDHREFLGDTVAAIAAEKAGILRAGVPCISAPQLPEAQQVIRACANRVGCDIHWTNPETVTETLGLIGIHQRVNAAVATEVVRVLHSQFMVTEQARVQGLAGARWPARLQKLRYGPLVEAWGARGDVMLDGGHNAHAARALADWARTHAPVVMVVGLMQRKDARAYLMPLAGAVEEVACMAIPNHPESHGAEGLGAAANVAGFTKTHLCASMEEAVSSLAHVEKATLLVAGSLALAGEILKNHG